MATGRLASASIAANGATQLYRNTTGNPQVITLLASSQISGSTPKLNVKITNENITSNTTVTSTGTNHTLTYDYPTATQTAGFAGIPYVLGLENSETADNIGHGFKHYATDSSHRDYMCSRASFGTQIACTGETSSATGKYSVSNSTDWGRRHSTPCWDPYYFANPGAYNQNKARGVVADSNGDNMYHIEDISKMPMATMKKFYVCNGSAGSALVTNDAPPTDASTYGTVTARGMSYMNRSWCYDVYTGLWFGVNNNGYCETRWFDENNPSTGHAGNGTTRSSDSGIFRWGTWWTSSDPRSYDNHLRGSTFGSSSAGFFENGILILSGLEHNAKLGFKNFQYWFGNTLTNKDSRASTNGSLSTYESSSYYHDVSYSSASSQKLQWFKYNPNTDKYYICLWDTSGTYTADPPTQGTSYTTESGIFEVDITRIHGYEHSEYSGDYSSSNGRNVSIAQAITDGLLTKKGNAPTNSGTGMMMPPVRLSASLWVSMGGDGKQYYSTDLITWGENTSSTYYDNSYAMMNTKGTGTVKYFIAAGARSIVYSATTTADVYDQAAVAGIIAKGAVTPYEQKSIILSEGDAIYVENEDATNAISITAMGVDV